MIIAVISLSKRNEIRVELYSDTVRQELIVVEEINNADKIVNQQLDMKYIGFIDVGIDVTTYLM